MRLGRSSDWLMFLDGAVAPRLLAWTWVVTRLVGNSDLESTFQLRAVLVWLLDVVGVEFSYEPQGVGDEGETGCEA